MFRAVKKWIQDRKEKSEVVSIVILQSVPRLMDRQSLTDALASIEISTTLTEEQTSYFRGVIDGFEMTIASLPAPYPALKGIQLGEQRLSDACAAHIAFTMIDTWKAPEGRKRQEARSIMARIAAVLTDEYVLAYYDWTSRKLCLPDDSILEHLAAGDLDSAVQEVGDVVINIEPDDDKIAAAVEEAQKRYPEFVEAFAHRSPDDQFILKARFDYGDNAEHLWMEVQSCDLESVTGSIANKPYHLARPREGDIVTVPASDLSDWLMTSPNGPVGGFVESLLRG